MTADEPPNPAGSAHDDPAKPAAVRPVEIAAGSESGGAGGHSPSADAHSAAAEAAAAAVALSRTLRTLVAASASGLGRDMRRWGGRFRGLVSSSARPSGPGIARERRDLAAGVRGIAWPKVRRRHALASLAVIGLVAISVPLAYAFYCLATLPVDGGLQVDPAQHAIVMQADDGHTFATRGVFRGDKLSGADLPPYLGKAVVAIEDRRFYDHHGIDLRGTVRALWRDVRAGGASREGGSTITQQLVRLTYLSPDKSLRRKLQEAMLSMWLETQLPKSEILLRYLNTAYFGAGAYGADAAAHRYFGKKPKDLTMAECAMLAGLVRAPSQLAPTRNLGGARERADTVIQAMADTGAITPQQAEAAHAEKISLAVPPETPPGTSYFADTAASEARRLPNGSGGDLTLRTTLNLELQRLAEGVIERKLDAEGERKKVSQAALVALRSDGAIVALVGGRDYEGSQFNRATQAKRQPGSLFKLFVYLTAFNKGYTPDSVMVDQPVRIGDWEPQNAENRFHGRMDLRSAFADSVNTVAAQLGQAVGIPAVIETARRLGVQSDLPNVPSLTLGSANVTLLEMTRAYADVAANSTGLEPFGVSSLTAGTGQVLYTRPPRAPGTPIGPARDMLVDAMQAVVEEGTGKAAHPADVAVAGKTGTTQDYRDAWFIGFTPEMTVGIWVGNDDNSPMNRVVGGDLPATIFREFVNRAEPILRPKAPRATEPERSQAAVADASAATAPSSPSLPVVRGTPDIIDTGTLAFRDRIVHLEGIEGQEGRMARQLAHFLRRREIACTASASDVGRCQVEGQDLSTMILEAGGARASADAPPELLAAEDQARSARLGIWRYER